jgi:anti-anti-sigma factor
MKLNTQPDSGVLTISGSVHTDTVASLRSALLDRLSAAPEVVLDMTGVDMCDTPALQVLFACQRSAAALGKPFRITASPIVWETIEAAGLDAGMLADVNREGGQRGS